MRQKAVRREISCKLVQDAYFATFFFTQKVLFFLQFSEKKYFYKISMLWNLFSLLGCWILRPSQILCVCCPINRTSNSNRIFSTTLKLETSQTECGDPQNERNCPSFFSKDLALSLGSSSEHVFKAGTKDYTDVALKGF